MFETAILEYEINSHTFIKDSKRNSHRFLRVVPFSSFFFNNSKSSSSRSSLLSFQVKAFLAQVVISNSFSTYQVRAFSPGWLNPSCRARVSSRSIRRSRFYILQTVNPFFPKIAFCPSVVCSLYDLTVKLLD